MYPTIGQTTIDRSLQSEATLFVVNTENIYNYYYI
jgi:hypothetical protein